MASPRISGTSAFTTSVNPLPNNDTIASVVLTSAGADASAAAGVYPITPSGAVAGPGTNLANYQIAYADAPIGLTVGRAAGSISIANIPAPGVVLNTLIPTYTQTGDGIASTTSSTPTVCAVSSGTVSFVGALATLTAALAQGTNHLAAIGASVQLTVNLSVDPSAATGARSVMVVNPDGGDSTALAAFTINAAPTITSLNPATRGQGATNENIVITGANFGSGTWANSSVTFSGAGITVNSVSRTDSTHLTVNISVAAGAATGARDVTVRNTDGGRATKVRQLHGRRRPHHHVAQPELPEPGRRQSGDRRDRHELRIRELADLGSGVLRQWDHGQLRHPDGRRATSASTSRSRQLPRSGRGTSRSATRPMAERRRRRTRSP